MLATLHPAGTARPSGPAWTFEPKYDGVRAIAVITGTSSADVSLFSRNGIDKAAQFPEVVEALARIPTALGAPLREAIVLDGEIVALDVHGKPARFQALQGRMHATRGVESLRRSTPSAYIAFDCLADGSGVGGVGDVPLSHLPWRHRRRRLERLLSTVVSRAATRAATGVVRLGETSDDGDAMLESAHAEGWEGIIAKRVGAPYRPGERSRDWLKLKIEGRQEFVIGGWTEPEGSRKDLGALLLGVHEADGSLRYVGRVGTGFTQATLRDLKRKLGPLAQATSPFASVPPRYRGADVHWVRPELIAEVKFTEFTADGILRHPSFQGLRDDKSARDVRREDEPVLPSPALRRSAGAGRPRGSALGPAPLRLLTQLSEIEATSSGSGSLVLPGGASLSVTSLGRVVLPRGKGMPAVTKGDLLRYYVHIAPVLLPAVADRPLVLKRYHTAEGGRARQTFYQQHAPTTVPDGIRVAVVGDGEKRRFIAGDLTTLLYVVQLGAISIDPWHARVGSPDTPDYAIIDLDPGPGVGFPAVVDCARWVKDELDRLRLHALAKTSGASGMHIVIPMPEGVPGDAARLLAEVVAVRVAAQHPRLATVVRSVRARPKGSIYVDYLQNIRGKTVASVYSARAEPGATVSTPLRWDEVTEGLDPRAFTIATLPARVGEVGDLWAAAMKKGNSLDQLLRATEPAAPPRSRAKR